PKIQTPLFGTMRHAALSDLFVQTFPKRLAVDIRLKTLRGEGNLLQRNASNFADPIDCQIFPGVQTSQQFQKSFTNLNSAKRRVDR
ncbi:hypothetical protein, partial [Xanthomonas euvesicatoria]|uniref:hypothetical protein n=1 Tax=Xanthomonas euvesicatoria TaxID=456327 RepID=UPI001C47627A